ncbi:MAG: hypothetical protein AB8E15_07220 [Bdellovibrionales bacterium]
MFKLLLLLSILGFTSPVVSSENRFLSSISFNLEGANLCEFESAFSKTRSEHMREMVFLAERLLYAGDFSPVKTLRKFQKMYEENLIYAKRGLGVTLEESFKSFMDRNYRSTRPKNKKLKFVSVNSLLQEAKPEIDLVAIGSYSFSPDCNGQVFVSLRIIEKNGITESFSSQGRAHQVMGLIAKQVFKHYQRTKFPAVLPLRNKTFTIFGGPNGDIDQVSNVRDAELACESMGLRLPKAEEYRTMNVYTSWSGGISLKPHVWAMKSFQAYNSNYKTAHVVPAHHTHARSFYYVCVK